MMGGQPRDRGMQEETDATCSNEGWCTKGRYQIEGATAIDNQAKVKIQVE